MSSKIKAVIFDLGGVYFADGMTKAITEFGEILHVPKDKLDEIFGGQCLGGDYRLGKISKRKFWKTVKGDLNLDARTINNLMEIWNSSYTRNWGMKTLVRRLRRRYKVAVLSDNIKERVEYLNKKYDLDKEFDCYIYSFNYSIMKPDKRLLRILLQKLKASLDEVILVDNSTTNVKSFREIGVKTILFRSTRQVKKELSDLLKDPCLS